MEKVGYPILRYLEIGHTHYELFKRQLVYDEKII